MKAHLKAFSLYSFFKITILPVEKYSYKHFIKVIFN